MPRSHLIKGPRALAAISRACTITATTFRAVAPTIRPGLTERQIARRLERIMKSLGGEGLAFSTIVAIGSHAAEPHHTPTTRRLPRGGFVLLDFGCVVNGYHSDMTRMIFLSPPRGKMKEIFKIVQSAQRAALKTVRPNVAASKIDTTARDLIMRAGYGAQFTHSTGHGVGLEIHERPWINKTNSAKLKPNMVITVEPGIYLPGLGGVRLEDTLVVTKSGHQILTK